MKPLLSLLLAVAETKLEAIYHYALKASWSFIPLGAVVGALEFKDFIYTAVLSAFGAVVGVLVRILLDKLYERYKAEKAKKQLKDHGKDC